MTFPQIRHRRLAGSKGFLDPGLLLPGSAETPAASPLLLDAYPGAVAAYSLRKLRTAYSGAAIRVRRSSDNAEADIGFSGSALDTAALLAHVGAGSGYVTAWYDQSGNGKDAVNAAVSTQPRIVDSGVVDVADGLPQILMTSKEITASEIYGAADFSVFFVGTTQDQTFVLDAQTGRLIFSGGHSGGAYYDGAWRGPVLTTGRKVISWVLVAPTSGLVAVNGSVEGAGLSYTQTAMGGTEVGIGSRYNSTGNGVLGISELIVFASDHTSNRVQVEEDINDYWGVY